MSDDLRDLYQDLILDHGKRPRNFKVPEGANCSAKGHNPLCGDELTLHMKLEDGAIVDIGFQGTGCAISRASASLMTGALKGRSQRDAAELFEKVHALVTQGSADVDLEALGKLASLSGVSEFPARVKCASLAWHTLMAALEGRDEAVSTE